MLYADCLKKELEKGKRPIDIVEDDILLRAFEEGNAKGWERAFQMVLKVETDKWKTTLRE